MIPWRRTWQPAPVFLPGEFHRQRNDLDKHLGDPGEVSFQSPTGSFAPWTLCPCVSTPSKTIPQGHLPNSSPSPQLRIRSDLLGRLSACRGSVPSSRMGLPLGVTGCRKSMRFSHRLWATHLDPTCNVQGSLEPGSTGGPAGGHHCLHPTFWANTGWIRREGQ